MPLSEQPSCPLDHIRQLPQSEQDFIRQFLYSFIAFPYLPLTIALALDDHMQLLLDPASFLYICRVSHDMPCVCLMDSSIVLPCRYPCVITTTATQTRSVVSEHPDLCCSCLNDKHHYNNYNNHNFTRTTSSALPMLISFLSFF